MAYSDKTVSIAGLWVTIDGSVLETITQSAAGVSDMQVQIVRSFVRSASSPLRGFMDDHSSVSELPAPSGFIAAPDPYQLIDIAAGYIHGSDFQLRPQNQYEPERFSVDSSSLLKKIFKRLLADLRSLKHTLFKGYVSDVSTMVDQFTQGVIGDNSFLNCLPSPVSENARAVTEQDISNAISELDKSSRKRERVLWNGPSAWTDVLDYALGVVDGGEKASSLRRDAGSDKWVVLEKSVLVDQAGDDFAKVVGALQNGDLSNVATRQSLLQMFLQGLESKLNNQNPVRITIG